MKSVYISGPYTAPDREGEDKNIRAPAFVASVYLSAGWAVFCPHTMTAPIDREFNEDQGITYDDWLTLDLYWLKKCDAIHMLPGWRQSKGARIEYMAARALGLGIRGEVESGGKEAHCDRRSKRTDPADGCMCHRGGE